MLIAPSGNRRLAGRAIIVLAAIATLPLTASRATEYVDVPAARVVTPQATGAISVGAAASATPGSAAASALGSASTVADSTSGAKLPYPDLGGVTLGRNDIAFMADDSVLINGNRKSLDQLSASERSRLRQVILKSQRDLVRDRERLPGELAEARREADRARNGELRREHMQDIADMRRDLAELDLRAKDLPGEGEGRAARRAEIVRDLRDAEATDITAEEREAIAEDNPAKRLAELRSDEQQMARMLARLDLIERR